MYTPICKEGERKEKWEFSITKSASLEVWSSCLKMIFRPYNLETTEKITDSLNGMVKRQSSLEYAMKGVYTNWPSYYLDHATGPAIYAFQIQLYILALC